MNILNPNTTEFLLVCVTVVWVLGLIVGVRLGKKERKKVIIHNPYAETGIMEADRDDIKDHTGTIVVNVIEEAEIGDYDFEDIATYTFNITTDELKKRKNDPLGVNEKIKTPKEVIKKEDLIDINKFKKDEETTKS